MANIFTGSFRPPIPASSIRNSHHRVARLAASGLRNFEIAERTRRDPQAVSVLLASPAMQELVLYYRGIVDAAFERKADEYTTLATANMLRAENLIAERLDDAEDPLDPKPIPVKDLLAISRDAADRFGYGKKSMVFNPGTDFAALMEKALARADNATAKESESADG